MKTLIFDFDGTLADSFELAIEIAYGLTGMSRQSEAQMARLRQLPLLKAARELGISIHRIPRLLIKGRQLMLERIEELQPFPGIPEMLAALHHAGYHLLVISSNSEQNVRLFLRSHQLELYFDGVYGGVPLFNKAHTLRQVMKRNRLDRQNCFYIGDEVRDIVAATKVRVEPVAVTWGYQAPETLAEYHPYALAHKPRDLLRIFAADKV